MKKKFLISIIAVVVLIGIFCTFVDGEQFVDKLWNREADNEENSFRATIIELKDTTVIVEPLADEEERRSSDRISFGITELEEISVDVGSVVEVTYTGGIRERYPASIDVIEWKISKDLRHLEYTGN